MSSNTYTTIDRRPTIPCGCGCGQEATLQYFATHEGKLILPNCLQAHKERIASQRLLRGIVLIQLRFWKRMKHARTVYSLQRSIFDRQGTSKARRAAFRTALIYLLGTRVGLWMSLLWRK